MAPEETAVVTAETQFFPCSFLSEFNYCSVSYTSLSKARTRKRSATRKRAKQRAREAELALALSTDAPITAPSEQSRLNHLRYLAHKAFDPLWQGEGATMTRPQAYAWLAQTLSIPREFTHMSMFSESQCRTVLAAIENRELLEQINPRVKWGEVQKRREAKRKPFLHHVIREEKALDSFR